jgi:Autotransporter beta-domain
MMTPKNEHRKLWAKLLVSTVERWCNELQLGKLHRQQIFLSTFRKGTSMHRNQKLAESSDTTTTKRHAARLSLVSSALGTALLCLSGNASAQYEHCAQYPESSSCQGYHSEGGFSSVRFLEARWALDFSAYVSQIIGARNRGSANRPPVAGLDQGTTGLAASASGQQWNGWVAAAHSNMKHSFLRADGHANVLLGGVDYTLTNNATVGVATTLERSKTSLVGSNIEGDGYSVAPYVAIPLNANWLFDASAGVGRTDLDNRIGAVVASTKDRRTFNSASLTYGTNMGKWQMQYKASYLGSKDKFNTTPRTTSKLNQIRIGGQATYDAGNTLPYVAVNFIRDVSTPPAIVGSANDRDAIQLQAGVNFYSNGPLSGGISYSHDANRKEVKSNILVANLSVRF